MYSLPRSILRAVQGLSKLPTIGEKSAEKMVFNLLNQNKWVSADIGKSIQTLWDGVCFCEMCGSLSETPICSICQDEKREKVLCIVKDSFDMFMIEKSGAFGGYYHVLGGLLSPMDGVTPATLKIDQLIDRIVTDEFSEVVYALDSSLSGEATAHYIEDQLKESQVDVHQTLLARGIPMGTDLSFVNDSTLRRAIENRK